MVEIKPFKGTRPYNEDAKNLIAPSTDHLSIENIEIFKKNNYWNYLKILNLSLIHISEPTRPS